MNRRIFTIDELLRFNEMMLGRGMPIKDDGIGYNKADYSVCATYFYGISDTQALDLAKRLVKYSNTQLHIDRQKMKDTEDYYRELTVGNQFKKEDGVSVNIEKEETVVSFRYNESFINVIRQQPNRRWDALNKQWIIPNEYIINTLEALRKIGADVNNAIEYTKNHELIKNYSPSKRERSVIKYSTDGDYVYLSFDYDADIISIIKKVENRKYISSNKTWRVNLSSFKTLSEQLKNRVYFKPIRYR